MTCQGTVVFRGESGERYRFQVWPLGTRFKAVGAVCIFSKRTFSNPTFTQTASHKCLCIGETSDLSRLPYQLPQASSADCVCVYLAGEEQQRHSVQRDLLDGLGVWSSTLAVALP